MKPADVQEDHVYLKAFPHSLEGNAKNKLYYLAPRSITSWDDLKRLFLAKFFLTSRTKTIRKEVSSIKQQYGETLYEYWERFKNLYSSCPHHHNCMNSCLVVLFLHNFRVLPKNRLAGMHVPLGGTTAFHPNFGFCHELHGDGLKSARQSTRSDAFLLFW